MEATDDFRLSLNNPIVKTAVGENPVLRDLNMKYLVHAKRNELKKRSRRELSCPNEEASINAGKNLMPEKRRKLDTVS